jgi:DEAD/DEAH box helicase domain-containing protein
MSSLPWQRPQGLAAVLASWYQDPKVAANLVLHQTLAARAGHYIENIDGLSSPVRRALEKRAVQRLYSHQARCLALGDAGRDFVIATPTSSGKSLCYALPVLNRLLSDPEARTLYLCPTKALSRDQESSLVGLMQDAGLGHAVVTYDGDTPGDVRRRARRDARVVVSNPDMLHAGILPHHPRWAHFFTNLRFVVIDEVHTYRGVFGSHLANVLRRLLRIARFHGSAPTFMLASATIGNPQEHASDLCGRPVELVAESGAPDGEREVLLFNPPLVNAQMGVRQSYLKAAVRLTSDLVGAGVSTLLFGQSRSSVEVMLRYLRIRAEKMGVAPQGIVGYRGGYLPARRRSIERGLREGTIGCVVATNALELGIDIGSLDAVVCAGYPGSIASLWQRFGRAGRRGAPSLALLVGSSAPLDQYFALHPDCITGAPAEQARIDPNNPEILVQHVKCAAFELPLRAEEGLPGIAAETTSEVARYLSDNNLVHEHEGSFHWSSEVYPASEVSLRSIGWDNFVVIDEHERVIAEVDWRSTHTMLHEQAIYQHEGDPYQVERLDYDNHKAYVRSVEPDYYTTAMTYTRVSFVEIVEGAEDMPGCLQSQRGDVSVVEKVTGYKKIKFHSHENVGYGDVHLPEIEMHTTAWGLSFHPDFLDSVEAARPVLVDAISAFGRLLQTVAAVHLMTDPRDIGIALNDADEAVFSPMLVLFDRIPGGVGLAGRCFRDRAHLLAQVEGLYRGCGCEAGCLACIGPILHPEDRRHAVLGALLSQFAPLFGCC